MSALAGKHPKQNPIQGLVEEGVRTWPPIARIGRTGGVRDDLGLVRAEAAEDLEDDEAVDDRPAGHRYRLGGRGIDLPGRDPVRDYGDELVETWALVIGFR